MWRRSTLACFAAALALSACSSHIETDGGAVDVTRSDTVAIDTGADAAVDRVVPSDTTTVDAFDAVTPMDTVTVDVPTPIDTPAAEASTCGSCDPGFACGAHDYCVNARGIPAFGHVYLLVMENHSLDTIVGATSAPYINGLISRYTYASNYHAVTHPSLPNYIALVSGDTFGVSCDCSVAGSTCNILTCNRVLGSCGCPQTGTHLADQLDAASIRWRSFGEGMGAPCTTTDNAATNFAPRHVPFLYFDNVRTDTARCNEHVRDYTDFSADLAAGDTRFTMLTPNLCHDMHDACGGDAVQNGDTWLSTEVPAILAQPGFQDGGNDVLFIVWDEESLSLSSSPMPLIVVSPLVRAGPPTAVMYDHYSLLATIEDGLGIGRLAHATSAPVISDVWR